MDKRGGGGESFSEEVRSGRKTRESFGYGPKSAVTVKSKDTGHRVKQTAAVIGKRGTKRSIIPVQSLENRFSPSIQCEASLISTRNRCVLKMCKQVSDLQC